MELTTRQKQHFYDKGYVHVPGVVPRIMVDAAVRAINHSVGQGMNVEDMPILRAQSYCPELRTSPLITGLLNATPTWSLAESLLGAGNINPVKRGQIALRFPQLDDAPRRFGGHLDGIPTATNGVPPGTVANFSMLVGVLLSDLPHDFAGNFTVWPGTHHQFEKYFQEHDPMSLADGMPKIDLPEPQQITGQAGDVVLCHYQLVHGIAPHISTKIRYAIFFRLKHHDHDSHPMEVMSNIWMDWPGLEGVTR